MMTTEHEFGYESIKIRALAAQLDIPVEAWDDIEVCGDRYSYDGQEWLVYTDSEADQAFEAAVESYVDDCVLDQIPERYRSYFDLERFARDVELSDGRGDMLASYDGAEEEQKVDGEWILLYRIG